MNLRAPLALLAGLLLFSASSVARADAIPPDVAACDMKTAGAACTISASASGTCQMSKCQKLDYSMRNDAGAPTTVTYDCLQCKGAGDGGTATDGGTTAQTSGGGCSASGGKLAGSWGLALAPMAVVALVRRLRRRKA
jgi:uncharacterized membrane protein YgcG